MFQDLSLKKILIAVGVCLFVVVALIFSYIGTNNSLFKNNSTPTSTTITNDNSQTTQDTLPQDEFDIDSPPVNENIKLAPDSKEITTSNEEILVINTSLTTEQEEAISKYTPFGTENYNTNPDLAKTSNSVFIRKSGTLYYAGNDVDYLSEFEVAGTKHWFYTLRNTDGSQNLFLSEPDFTNPREITSIEAMFIEYITSEGNGIYKIYKQDGNGVLTTTSFNIDPKKAITDSNTNILVN